VHGIYHQSTGSIVNNTVYSNPGSVGIVLWHDARDIRIDSNRVFDNAVGISVGSGDWYQGRRPADNVVVVNNIVHDNEGAGIQEHGLTGTHNTYRDNVVYGNGRNYGLQNGNRPVDSGTAPAADDAAAAPPADNAASAGAPAAPPPTTADAAPPASVSDALDLQGGGAGDVDGIAGFGWHGSDLHRLLEGEWPHSGAAELFPHGHHAQHAHVWGGHWGH
jgi:hypothetical protein